MNTKEYILHFFKSPLGICLSGILFLALVIALVSGVNPLIAIPSFLVLSLVIVIIALTSNQGVQSVKKENERLDSANNKIAIEKAKEKSKVLARMRIPEKEILAKISSYLLKFNKYLEVADEQALYEPVVFNNLEKILEALDIYIEKKNEKSENTHFSTDSELVSGLAIDSADDAKNYLLACLQTGTEETSDYLLSLTGSLDDRLEIQQL